MAPSVKIDSTPQRALIIVPTVLLVFSTLAIGLRFYARRIKRQRFEIEDALALGGLVFFCLSLPRLQLLMKSRSLPTVFTLIYVLAWHSGGSESP